MRLLLSVTDYQTHDFDQTNKYMIMKTSQLDSNQYKTVFVRKQGELRAVKVLVKHTQAMPAYPMFPIERPNHGR